VTTHVVRLKVFRLKTEGKKELKIFFQEERSYNNRIISKRVDLNEGFKGSRVLGFE